MGIEKYIDPGIESVLPFMQALEVVRQEVTSEQWKNILNKFKSLRKWRYFLCNDPFTRWAYIKPYGYQGDATVLDFAYKHKSVSKEIAISGSIGQQIYTYTSSSKQSYSARLRIELIASEINKFSRSISGSISVASYASGHGRELEILDESARRSIHKFTAVDSDKASLQELLTSSKDLPVHLINKNVFRHNCDEPEYDFIYSLGLFDYLNDKQAKVLGAKMWKSLKSGGKMIIANLSHTAGNIGYCEAIMDWWMITRSQNDMLSIADHIVGKSAVANYESEQMGCFHYLSIVKN
jgi:hypothetical protein